MDANVWIEKNCTYFYMLSPCFLYLYHQNDGWFHETFYIFSVTCSIIHLLYLMNKVKFICKETTAITISTLQIYKMFFDYFPKNWSKQPMFRTWMSVLLYDNAWRKNMNTYALVWLVWFYGISIFVGYLTPNPFLCK